MYIKSFSKLRVLFIKASSQSCCISYSHVRQVQTSLFTEICESKCHLTLSHWSVPTPVPNCACECNSTFHSHSWHQRYCNLDLWCDWTTHMWSFNEMRTRSMKKYHEIWKVWVFKAIQSIFHYLKLFCF